ncbi:MAG: ribbon-helix-helix protein, CopG family [Desulfurococcaceae archaeon TW002]
MGRKKRFGVSIPADLSDRVKEIASKKGVTRSRIIEEVLRNYITESTHEETPHHCSGIIVVVKEKPGLSLETLYEDFREIIVGYAHQHMEGACVNVLFVSGASQEIENLTRNLSSCGCFTKFMPLHLSDFRRS